MTATREYIDQKIDDFQKATRHNAQTPGRQGSLVHLTVENADEVMITGDLHGNRRNFNLIRKIADLDHHPRRHLVVQEVCHGGMTYPQNGGCMSHTMLEEVARWKCEYPDRIHFLLGNHEIAEMTEYPIQKKSKMLNFLFRLGMQQMFGQAAEEIREAYVPFLLSSPVGIRLGENVLITHSIPQFVDERGFDTSIFDRELSWEDFLEDAPVFQLLWGRDYRSRNAKAFAGLTNCDVLINGHEPCPEGCLVPNQYQVIVDSCNNEGKYLLLSTDRRWTHEAVVDELRPLQN